jgi:transcriptional regulator with XRE-family HTH domain
LLTNVSDNPPEMTIDLQPRLLQWARERAGLTAETLAEKLGVSAEKVAAWEQDGRITHRQAEKLASVTHTAFGYSMRQAIEEGFSRPSTERDGGLYQAAVSVTGAPHGNTAG